MFPPGRFQNQEAHPSAAGLTRGKCTRGNPGFVQYQQIRCAQKARKILERVVIHRSCVTVEFQKARFIPRTRGTLSYQSLREMVLIGGKFELCIQRALSPRVIQNAVCPRLPSPSRDFFFILFAQPHAHLYEAFSAVRAK